MIWTKDAFDWRSEADKKAAIEKIYSVRTEASSEFIKWSVNFLENLKTPFRVTAVGLSVHHPAVFRIIDADGDEYDCEHNEHNKFPFLIPHHVREHFKKTAAVLEEREEVEEVSPDAAELWSLLNMMVDDARLIMSGVPVKSVHNLLRDLRQMRKAKLKSLDADIKHVEKRISVRTQQKTNLEETRKKYECL